MMGGTRFAQYRAWFLIAAMWAASALAGAGGGAPGLTAIEASCAAACLAAGIICRRRYMAKMRRAERMRRAARARQRELRVYDIRQPGHPAGKAWQGTMPMPRQKEEGTGYGRRA